VSILGFRSAALDCRVAPTCPPGPVLTSFAAGEAYGNNTGLRARLRELGLNHVLAVSRDQLVPIGGGKICCRADRLTADLPAAAWTRRSAGDGSKGSRFYEWAWLADVGADDA
jgi:hypothetical protein